MEKRFIYATNRSQVIYRFLIVDENESEYIVYDDSTSSYELSQVKFYINKEDLCKARCEDKTWAFIVTEDFFASFNLEDVKKEYNNRQKELIIEVLKREKERLKELEDKRKEIEKSYNNFFSFNDFKLNDNLYVFCEGILCKTKVVSFTTLDKINFIPNIKTWFGDCIEDFAPLRQNEDGELYIHVIENYYDDIHHNNYKVFLSEDDYNTYLEIRKNQENEDAIKSIKSHINKLERDLLKL